MRKRILAGIIVALSVLILIGLFSKNKLSDYAHVLEINWGITFPSGFSWEEEYTMNSGSSFHGDGIRYHVFSTEKAKNLLSWENAEGMTRHYESYSDAAINWLEEISVPQKWWPDFDTCQYWYQIQEDNSEIIVFLDSTLKRVYVIESFL